MQPSIACPEANRSRAGNGILKALRAKQRMQCRLRPYDPDA